ncbi:conserved membrane hypothetical protein [Cupriavidus taiwanensis]|uniref:DUF6708 domain-containing protein n=1 Tax=Cupriavidus taiwanensis TaxID=164546 RepID=A0A375C742_9BURK|nr:DUF6708 domain-containing protein [Cupriavidus taiwanensis]SOY64049.1 conserved membrane hypothetical protein [Cupriavidus taiwanensis]
MAAKKSRLTPQSPYWYQDLPLPEEQFDSSVEDFNAGIGEDLSHIDEHYLEVSRATSINRGAGLLFSLGMLIGMFMLSEMIYSLVIDEFWRMPAMSAGLGASIIGFLILIMHVVKREIRTPRDLPVRFYRSTGRIVAQEYITTLNPFARWIVVAKEMNWHDVVAEVAKVSGSNGKNYSVRYGLILAGCVPGTNTVNQRIVLKADEVFPVALQRMWNFIRRYMSRGMNGLEPSIRSADVSLTRCLLRYYPVLDFTVEGPDRRKHLHAVVLAYNAIVFIPLFWIFVPVGLCEYLALKLAPEPLDDDQLRVVSLKRGESIQSSIGRS